MPAVEHTLSIIGFSLLDGASEPNNAFMVARLKPFADRKAAADSAQALIRRTFGAGSQIGRPNVFRLIFPPSTGLPPTAGSRNHPEALEGQDPAPMGDVA